MPPWMMACWMLNIAVIWVFMVCVDGLKRAVALWCLTTASPPLSAWDAAPPPGADTASAKVYTQSMQQ